MANTRLLYIVMVVMLLTQNVSVQAGKKVYRITDTVFTCSSFLSVIITQFCNSTYKIVKRDTSMKSVKLSTPYYKSNKRWLAEERWRRVRRQIASECCEQPCTIREMIKYCPDNARLVQEQPEIFD